MQGSGWRRWPPSSRAAQWGRADPTLRQRLGARYLHLRQFGNLNHKTHGTVHLADAAGGMRALWAARRPSLDLGEPAVVLMRACRDRVHCHPLVVATILEQRLGQPRSDELRLAPQANDAPVQLSHFHIAVES